MPGFHRFFRRRATGSLFVAALAVVSIATAVADPGVWVPSGGPARNRRLQQQPRPPSAPAAPSGHAVQLLGTIESFPLPPQPRPQSAAPKRLDAILSSLANPGN